MKRKHLFVSLLAAIAFAGCSENDDPAPNNGGNDLKDCGYIAVNIVQPEGIGGRAGETTGTEGTADNSFADGDENENAVGGASFFIYKKEANGTFTFHSAKNVTAAEITPEDPGVATTPQTEKIYQAILVLDMGENGTAFDGEIFCVLNPTSDIQNMEHPTRENLLKTIGDYRAHTKNNFLITNSVYNTVCGTEFGPSNLQTSEDDAIANPVDIYVERVVAKVDATVGANMVTGTVEAPYSGAPEYKIRITGIELANVAPTAGLFKCLSSTDGFNQATFPTLAGTATWSFHDPANKRSYWEFTPTTTAYENQSYNQITATPADANGVFTGKNITELKNQFDASFKYIQPNTSSPEAIVAETPTSATCILVTAQLGKEETKTEGDKTTTTFTPADLVWIVGSYFSNEGAKNLLCDYLDKALYRIKTTDDGTVTYSSILPEHLVWKQTQTVKETVNGIEQTKEATVSGLKDYQAVAQLVDGIEIVKKNADDTYEDAKDEANAFLTEDKYRAEVFKNGMCYYFVPIDQAPVMGTAKDTNTFYGIVRNHVYKLDLTSISGIGTAVFDPTKTIIPTTPKHERFRYLAAKVNVLKWKIVSQNINFEGN